MKRCIPALVLALIAAFFTAGLPPASAVAAPPVSKFAVGQKAPAFSAWDQYQRSITLRKFTKQWVILHFVSEASSYSLSQGANSQGVVDLLRANNVPATCLTIVLADNFNRSSTADTAISWALRNKLTEPILHVNGLAPRSSLFWSMYVNYLAAVSETTSSYNLPGLPLTVLIDPAGKISRVIGGELTPAELLDRLGHGELTYTPVTPPGDLQPPEFTLTATYGTHSGSLQEPSADDTFTSGDLPSNFVLSSRGTASGSSALYEFDVSLSDSQTPHDVPISLALSNLQWSGETGLAGYTLHTLTILNGDARYHQFPLFPAAETADSLTFGPLSLDQYQVSGRQDFYDVTFYVMWLRPSPLNYTSRIEADLRDGLVRSYARKVRSNLAPGGNLTKAIDYLHKIEARLPRLSKAPELQSLLQYEAKLAGEAIRMLQSTPPQLP